MVVDAVLDAVFGRTRDGRSAMGVTCASDDRAVVVDGLWKD